MTKTIEHIYFDAGAVLLNIQKIIDDLALLIGESSAEFNAQIESINQQAFLGNIDSTQLWSLYESTLFKQKTPYTSWIDFCVERFDIIPETYELLKEIQGKYPIGIISNTEQGIFEAVAQKKLFGDIKFSPIIQSCDIGFAKPQPEIYAYAEKLANVLPETILFVDDRIANTQAAEERGWQTVLFDPANPKKSVEEIRSLLMV